DHSAIPTQRDQTGGLSGAPLREKSTAFIRAIRGQTTLPIVGVGGIFDAESAREKLNAGAQLVQIYTGYIYRGPQLVREIVGAL
ncbi:MAG: quinone-dependent dihydroorotate dehydrogenase, partial [Chthoniobacterales bacterium]